MTYTYPDIVAALNRVAPYDWDGFWHRLLDRTSTHAPLAGIVRGGWKLAYGEKPNEYEKALVATRHVMLAPWFTLGLRLKNKGAVTDVLWNGPAFKAGMAPGMVLVAVDGERFSPAVLKRAIAASVTDFAPIRLTVKNQGRVERFSVDYHGPLKYPQLVRIKGTPDYLDQILAPKKA